jgi:hypothetical protein
VCDLEEMPVAPDSMIVDREEVYCVGLPVFLIFVKLAKPLCCLVPPDHVDTR